MGSSPSFSIPNFSSGASEKGYNRLMEALGKLAKVSPGEKAGDFDTDQWLKKCYAAMDDDFNSPLLIAQLFEAVKFINQFF